MLIHDERHLILNDIVEQCRKMASHYRENASLTEDRALAVLFVDIGRQCREMAAGLEDHLRHLGWLPAAPDSDGELVEELITRVKVAWLEDRRLQLLAEMQQAEDRLAGLIAAALRHDFPTATTDLLLKMQEAVAADLKRLAAA